jgi:endoglucanase
VDCDPPSGSGTSSSELNYELTGETKELDYSETPYGKHGKLSLQKVSGYGNAPVIVDESGQPFQLRGASTHGIQWGEMKPYVNEGAFQSLRDEWGVNMVRLAGYVTQGGYTQGSKDSMDETFQKGVEAATKLGMYVIVDWHIHAENPHDTIDDAKTFFQTYATKYKDYGNVIFEICNEPTGVEWYTDGSTDLYSYCKTISQIIRDCGSNSIIVCGTNTWSQDVDDVVKKPLADDGFENIMYTFHFYSGSHYEDKMKKVKQAVSDGTPIFVTEFGICDASGNGGFDTANADAWIELLDSYNISYACWSLCNKNESASYLATSCTKTTGGWTSSDLATTGIWLVNTYRAHEDAENGVTPTTKAPSTAAPATTKTPTTTKTPATTVAPSQETKAPDTSSATETPGQDLTVTDPQTTAEPTGSLDTPQPEGTLGSTAVPSGSEATKAPATTQTPVATVTPTVMSGSISYEPTVTAAPTVTVTKKATVRLKKSVIRIKKGQKARIVIRKKATGDKVKKYTVSGKKNIITISKAGVVKGRKKGTVRVKVVMKSGASAWCRIVVRS